MKFYKSFLFLFILDLFLILPVLLFLEWAFLIPASLCLCIFNAFLFYFPGMYLKRKFLTSAIPRDDHKGTSIIFEDFKRKYNVKNIHLLKVRSQEAVFFYFRQGRESFVLVSEDILENFSGEDISLLLQYPFRMRASGDLLFLTLLSAFLFLVEKLSYFLSSPFFFIHKKPPHKTTWLLIAFLWVFSFITRPIYFGWDKNLFSQPEDKKRQALFLYKIESFIKLKNSDISSFMSPLCLISPLTDPDWECYISLQPLIRKRLECLVGTYPP